MPGNLEIEKIRRPLPIPKSPKEQLSISKKRKKLLKKSKEGNNHEKEIEMKNVRKGDYKVYFVGSDEVDPKKFVGGKIPLNVTEI